MIISFLFLSASVRTLPIGTAYAVWTGIGAVGTAILGILLFAEPRDTARIVCILFIVVGILGLKFVFPPPG
jgi:quaternary ammonium compound-resistance protein SugE